MLSALNTNGTIKIKEFKTTRDHTVNMLKSWVITLNKIKY